MAHVEWTSESIDLGSSELSGTVSETLAKIAAEVAEDARRMAPVDTGLLKSSIDSELTGPNTARVTAAAPYALWVERGTSRMRARPYLRPALWKARGV